jgi:peptide/nickel transport system permease protein
MGDPTKFLINPNWEPEYIEIVKQQYGLDKPIFPDQYAIYLINLVHGSFGNSFKYKVPVTDVIASRLTPTLILLVASMVLSVLLGVVVGVYGAWKRGGKVDMGVLASSMVLNSLPSFWLGIVLLLVLAFYFPIFPLAGIGDLRNPLDVAQHFFLPVLTLTLVSFTRYALITRNTVVMIYGEEYITAARASGVPNGKVLYKHILRNSLLPLITVIGTSLPIFISSIILIEYVFSLPGIGLLIIDSARALDYPLMQGVFFILAAATIIASLVADILYGVVDPRIKL